MSALDWPIRVGGVYRSNLNPGNVARKVTRVDGDEVRFDYWYKGESRPWGSDWCTQEGFRSLCLAEDQSPLPRMYALLDRLAFLEGLSPELHAEIDSLIAGKAECGGAA